MPKSKSDSIRIRHMLDAINKALHFMKDKSREDLSNDELLSLALVRLLEVLGEAAAKVSADVTDKYPAIPWHEIIGTRNRLIHGYDDVNLDILWQIVSVDLLPLPSIFLNMLQQLEQTEQHGLFPQK
jgi:uncharacterized protein with HEPN domain